MPVSFDLTGKTALVTGATRGIGRAIVTALARAGAAVAVSSRKAEACEECARALRAAGANAVPCAANVGRPADARALVDFALAELGGVDILVNNAAVSPLYGPLADMTDEAFDKILSVNLKAPWRLATYALPSMKERGGGSIINISSIDGLKPDPDLAIYSASKAALINLTLSMARAWGALGVRANAICPGFIRTDFSATLWKNEPLLSRVLAEQPIARLGEPDDVAGLALLLAADAGRFCTGGVYVVDGGLLA
jgi:NAD(P)-dependent dehydrogenase (short-subunit alcohol dehydrogenase family)